MKSPPKPRLARSDAAIIANQILLKLGECKGVRRCEIAGSLRRGEPTCGDIDVVAAAPDPDDALREVEAALCEVAKVKKLVSVPDVGYKLVLSSFEGHEVKSEIWVVPPSHYGATLNWATGSRAHNRAVRYWCLMRGFKVPIGCHRVDRSRPLWWLRHEGFFWHVFKATPASDILESEEEFYNRIQLAWIPPDSRKDDWKVLLKAYLRWLTGAKPSRSGSAYELEGGLHEIAHGGDRRSRP